MFELLDHPADIGFRAHGRTLEELFANSALAMLSIAGEPEKAQPAIEYPLSAGGADRESLLVNWLNEVLYWFDGKQVAFREIRVTHLDEEQVRATGMGEPRDPVRHRSKLIVKAATYHQLKIARDGGGWLAEVFLDI